MTQPSCSQVAGAVWPDLLGISLAEAITHSSPCKRFRRLIRLTQVSWTQPINP
jgi:hypothetical protein